MKNKAKSRNQERKADSERYSKCLFLDVRKNRPKKRQDSFRDFLKNRSMKKVIFSLGILASFVVTGLISPVFSAT